MEPWATEWSSLVVSGPAVTVGPSFRPSTVTLKDWTALVAPWLSVACTWN